MCECPAWPSVPQLKIIPLQLWWCKLRISIPSNSFGTCSPTSREITQSALGSSSGNVKSNHFKNPFVYSSTLPAPSYEFQLKLGSFCKISDLYWPTPAPKSLIEVILSSSMNVNSSPTMRGDATIWLFAFFAERNESEITCQSLGEKKYTTKNLKYSSLTNHIFWIQHARRPTQFPANGI